MARPLLLIAPLALALLAGCSGGNGTHEPKVVEVTIEGSRFTPASIAIQQGDTVRWVNKDGVAHTATMDSGERDTGSIPPGGRATLNLPTPGTHRYHCKVHPAMVATVIVAGA